MVEQCFKLHNEDLADRFVLQRASIFLSVAAMIASAFHFWPFEHSKVWQTVNISNFSIILWIAIAMALYCSRYRSGSMHSFLPHTSILAYLIINILSMAMATNLERSASFTVKVVLVFLGGYLMFSVAISNIKTTKILYTTMIIATTISIFYCLFTRFALHIDKYGFHENAFKYGTYIAMLVPACTTYLFLQANLWGSLSAAALVICAFVSAGSLGTVAAITIGLCTALAVTKEKIVRRWIMASLILATSSMIATNLLSAPTVLNDAALSENDGTNLRQRYIEWQAEINSLHDRTVAGMAAGCINDYRSTFYYRLPKLNTLKPFDQNGWLTVASETGIIGLVCFCWIVIHYGKTACASILKYRASNSTLLGAFAQANIAGLSAACVANLFSSVQYNGVLIIFVLLLALIHRTNHILEIQ